ncbi:MAG: AAA family ATPase [Muribaculaceae bacterium]
METPKQNFVITIGRQYGSGGREIGRLVADALGIKYYDKELLTESSKASGVKPEVFEAADERTPSFFSNIWSFNLGFNAGSYLLGSTPISDEKIYAAQSNVMKTLAQSSSCLIVGRSADYVLRNHPGLISIFIHSSIEDRILRIMNRRGIDSAEKAREIAEKKDKLRACYYNFYTDKVWGEAAGYDLSIDSSKLPAEAVADFIVSYVKARLAQM